jgi:peptidoglycan biosynthesis protein MviN/MurJ (putative lipid II flippase)
MLQHGWIFGDWCWHPVMGYMVLSYGILIGASFHLFVQIPALLKLPELDIDWRLAEETRSSRSGSSNGTRFLGVAVCN